MGMYTYIHPIHFCFNERQQVRKLFLIHVKHLETCQCCASLLLRSLSFCSSLSALPTQQLCVSKPLSFSTSTRSTHGDEKANLLATLHHWREQRNLGLHHWTTDSMEKFVWTRFMWTTRTLQFYGYILWEWSHMFKQLNQAMHFLSSHTSWEQGYMWESNLVVHTTGIIRGKANSPSKVIVLQFCWWLVFTCFLWCWVVPFTV